MLVFKLVLQELPMRTNERRFYGPHRSERGLGVCEKPRTNSTSRSLLDSLRPIPVKLNSQLLGLWYDGNVQVVS